MKQEKFLLRVDNNDAGRSIIHSMRTNLNSNSYRIVIRYSGPRPAGTDQASTCRKNAKSIRVYVESKLEVVQDSPVDNIPQILRANQMQATNSLKQELREEKEENKVLEAKLTLLTTGLQNSSKYGSFVKVISSIRTLA